jgi:hypothetical protein
MTLTKKTLSKISLDQENNGNFDSNERFLNQHSPNSMVALTSWFACATHLKDSSQY